MITPTHSQITNIVIKRIPATMKRFYKNITGFYQLFYAQSSYVLH